MPFSPDIDARTTPIIVAPGEMFLLLVPAVDEPFGRKLIEAMLLGPIVVAAASGGNLEAIRDGRTGYLVPPDDPAAFAEQILRLLADPKLCSTVAEAARRDAMARFGLRRHAEAIMDVYDSMLSTRVDWDRGHVETRHGAPRREWEEADTGAPVPAREAMRASP